mmetsp:Transcript_13891/g.34944  ORF Transcript_13891/g.34944 Transcript_13891/m.34944 type:complete len:386 (-) Transcript_13891:61-1218(-)
MSGRQSSRPPAAPASFGPCFWSVGRLVEEGESHVVVRFLLRLFLGLLLGLGGGSWGGRSEGRGVGEHLLDLFGEVEGDFELGTNGDGKDLLVSVDDAVRHRGHGWHAGLEGDGGDSAESSGEAGHEVVVGDLQNLWAVDRAVLKDVLEDKSVGEWLDVQLGKKGSLGGSDLVSLADDLDVVQNLDGSPVNLGWDAQGLEETGLGWVQSGSSGRDDDIDGGDRPGLRWGTDLVLGNLVLDVDEGSGGEDDTDVSDEQVRNLVPERSVVLLGVNSQGSANHGVLTHENSGVVTDSATDVHELLGAHVVGMDDEPTAVGVEHVEDPLGHSLLLNKTRSGRHLCLCFLGSKLQIKKEVVEETKVSCSCCCAVVRGPRPGSLAGRFVKSF